jgi:hypothetical protein
MSIDSVMIDNRSSRDLCEAIRNWDLGDRDLGKVEIGGRYKDADPIGFTHQEINFDPNLYIHNAIVPQVDIVKKPTIPPIVPPATIATNSDAKKIKLERIDRDLRANSMTIPTNKPPIINLEVVFLIAINILWLKFIDQCKSAS